LYFFEKREIKLLVIPNESIIDDRFVNSPIHKHSSFNRTIKLLSFRLQIYSFYRFAFRLWVKKWLHEATKRAQVTDYLLFIYFFVLKNIKIKGAFHLDETPPCT